MNLSDIRRLFDYTEYANGLALDAAEKLTDEQRRHDFKISHGSIHGTLVHMAGGEWIWLERWKGTSHSLVWTADDFADVAALRSRWREIEAGRRELLEKLTEEGLRQDLSYKNLKGDPMRFLLGQLMLHAVNHSTYHRGQVTTLLRQLGAQPVSTDLVVYYAEKAKQA